MRVVGPKCSVFLLVMSVSGVLMLVSESNSILGNFFSSNERMTITVFLLISPKSTETVLSLCIPLSPAIPKAPWLTLRNRSLHSEVQKKYFEVVARWDSKAHPCKNRYSLAQPADPVARPDLT